MGHNIERAERVHQSSLLVDIILECVASVRELLPRFGLPKQRGVNYMLASMHRNWCSLATLESFPLVCDSPVKVCPCKRGALTDDDLKPHCGP